MNILGDVVFARIGLCSNGILRMSDVWWSLPLFVIFILLDSVSVIKTPRRKLGQLVLGFSHTVLSPALKIQKSKLNLFVHTE